MVVPMASLVSGMVGLTVVPIPEDSASVVPVELTAGPTVARMAGPTVGPMEARMAGPTVGPMEARMAEPTVGPTEARMAEPTVGPMEAETVAPIAVPSADRDQNRSV
jgi:hypothetical protein